MSVGGDWDEYDDRVDEPVEVEKTQRQYVCFVKSRVGADFQPYTLRNESSVLLVGSIREFLDREIDFWFTESRKGSIEVSVVSRVLLEHFVKDANDSGMNARLASMLGWNYAEAVRIVEIEGSVLLLTVHPRFESLPFSFIRVRDDDDYALAFVKKMLSIRGGEIVFEKYDPEKHVAGYRYEA